MQRILITVSTFDFGNAFTIRRLQGGSVTGRILVVFRNGGRRGDVTQAAKHGNRSERRNHALNKLPLGFASLCACLICIPLIHVSHRIAPTDSLEQSDTASSLKTKAFSLFGVVSGSGGVVVLVG